MAPRKRRGRKGRGTLLARLAALEDRAGNRGVLVLYAEGCDGQRWASTQDGRNWTGAQAEALYRAARERGDSFAFVAGVDMDMVLGDKPHATEVSGRVDVHGGVVVERGGVSVNVATDPPTVDTSAGAHEGHTDADTDTH